MPSCLRASLPTAVVLLWTASVGYPLLMSAGALLAGPARDVEARHAGALLLTTSAWSAAIALGAMALGWVPGRVLGAALHRRGYGLLAALYLLPVCLPAYAVFYAWWQAWPADSALYAWAVEHELVRAARLATLALGLTGWAWPIVAWCLAGAALARRAEHAEMLAIDGAGFWRRCLLHGRLDAPALALGGLVVFVLVFNNTTCFDLAEVRTFGNELRLVAAAGAPADELRVGLPAAAVTLAGVLVLWRMLATAPPAPAGRIRAPGAASLVLTGAIWTGSVGVPLIWLATSARAAPWAAFWRMYGHGFLNTVTLAGVTGAIVAVVALVLGRLWQDHRRPVRALAHVVALGWLLAAALPAHLIAAGLEAAWNVAWPAFGEGLRDGTGAAGQTGQIVANGLGKGAPLSDSTLAAVIYRSPAILVLGHVARFSFVGVLVGRWTARQEPAALTRLRRVDGADTLRGLVGSMWPRLLAAATASFALAAVLSLGEIPLTARLQPPGFEATASSILNAMHYQRPDIAVAGLLAFVAVAALVALATATIRLTMRRTRPFMPGLPVVALLVGTCGLGGCVPDESASGSGGALEPDLVFGRAGLRPGQFTYPRAIAVDADRELVYVIDKTARVQRFDFDGNPLAWWPMPESELGKPTGLNVAPDGRVFVADTHYFRIIAYGLDGGEIMRFGGYGEGPGQFIYPTDVVFGPGGRLYVSEYGGNDRVQVFTAEGAYLFAFGAFGSGEGRFNRPQSMTLDAGRGELYIADACNHRIVVTDLEGRFLRTFGESGRGAGQLLYPYDLALLGDGSLLVSEFGNNRIQRLSARDGESLGLYGTVGEAPGQLKYPWGVDVAGERVFVLDSGNDRVQVVRTQ